MLWAAGTHDPRFRSDNRTELRCFRWRCVVFDLLGAFWCKSDGFDLRRGLLASHCDLVRHLVLLEFSTTKPKVVYLVLAEDDLRMNVVHQVGHLIDVSVK